MTKEFISDFIRLAKPLHVWRVLVYVFSNKIIEARVITNRKTNSS